MAEITSALTASGYKSLCVYNDRLELLGRIESWLSLVWPERYNVYSNVQGAQLELHDTTARAYGKKTLAEYERTDALERAKKTEIAALADDAKEQADKQEDR